jgi:molecular chaperone DnaK
MVRESEKNAAEDKEKRDKIDLKNQSDSLCYQSEKQIQELGDKITKDDKTQIETSIKNLKEAIAGDNFEEIKKLNKKLQDELMEIGKKVYSTNSTTTQKTTNEKNTNNSDSVIDADFSETK